MKRSAYFTAATIAALTACKPTTVVVANNTATAAANTTANIAVNEVGVDNNLTSTGVIDVNNTAATNELVPPPDVNQQ
jgi:hypothetical protein